jgi:rRNA N6-adenosine-methyltransferase METTL5
VLKTIYKLPTYLSAVGLIYLYYEVLKLFIQVSMKRKHLESALSEVDVFDDPKIELEQIPTSPEIASHMLFIAENSYGDIEDKCVLDLGCGPGILSIAASLMGAATVCSIDVDTDALECAWVNLKKMEVENVDLVQADVQTLQLQLEKKYDTMICNPPFGTRNAGIDTVFIEKGLSYANTIYSLHKTSTREHFVKFCDKRGVLLEVIAELKYDIPRTFAYHKEDNKDVFVDLLRFSRIEDNDKAVEQSVESVFT